MAVAQRWVSDSDGADGQWYEREREARESWARRTSRGEGTKKEAVANNELEVRRALLSSHAGIVAYLYLPVVTPCAGFPP